MADVTQIKMTAAEFRNLPETNTPEQLIDGEIVVSPSPVKVHQDAVGNIYFFLRQLSVQNRIVGTVQIAPMDVYFDDENVTQPDVFWVSSANEKCKLGEDGYWYGAPDLIVEVLSPSTTRQDKVTKFELYERHGVREYWIVDPQYRNVEVWALLDSKYARLGQFYPADRFTSPVLGQELEVKEIFAV
jgi:Uma2 family endonuclease